MKRNMINVVPLLPGREKEMSADLLRLYHEGSIQSVLYSCSLVPEGNPVSDKASRFAELYRINRKALGETDLPTGILLQSTMGHGWTPAERAPYQKYTFHDGTEPYIFCPLDPDFLLYIRRQIHTLAATKPDFFMLDDDTAMFNGRGGCFCPRHMEEFNRSSGTHYTREELRKALLEDDALCKVWEDFQQEGALQLARIIREEFDAFCPESPGIFCTCLGDETHAPDMARILAGKNGKPAVRINNRGYLYLLAKPYEVLKWMHFTMHQKFHIPDDFDVLCETDTCEHSRIFTPAATIHCLYSWSLLNGCSGGKLWITDMKQYVPETGRAYRRKLSENNGFYDQIFQMKPEWKGLSVPLFPEARCNILKYPGGDAFYLNWGSECFGFLGLPFAYTKNPAADTIVALSRREAEIATEEQLKTFFAQKVLLDGGAAEVLTERGFAGWTGVSASAWDLPNPTFERFSDGTELFRVAPGVKLTPLPGSETRSMLYHSPYLHAPESAELTPGLVCFRNGLGGTVYTAAWKMLPYWFGFSAAVHCLRKRILCRELELPLWYAGDEPVACHFFLDRGIRTVCIFNMGLDRIEGVAVGGLSGKEKMRKLEPDGSWNVVPFENGIVQTNLLPMDLLFLRIAE